LADGRLALAARPRFDPSFARLSEVMVRDLELQIRSSPVECRHT